MRVLNWHPACPPRPSSPPSLPQRPPRSWAPGAAAATSRLLLVRFPGSSGPSGPTPPDGEAPSILKCALAFPHHKNPSSASHPAPLSEVTARLPAEAAVTRPPPPVPLAHAQRFRALATLTLARARPRGRCRLGTSPARGTDACARRFQTPSPCSRDTSRGPLRPLLPRRRPFSASFGGFPSARPLTAGILRRSVPDPFLGLRSACGLTRALSAPVR